MQPASTLKLLTFFFNISNRRPPSKVKKTKITSENTFNGDYFKMEGNHGVNRVRFFKKKIYYVSLMQQASILKLLTYILRFQTEDRHPRLLKIRLLVKTLLMEIILRWKVTMDPVKRKKLFFCLFLIICDQWFNH